MCCGNFLWLALFALSTGALSGQTGFAQQYDFIELGTHNCDSTSAQGINDLGQIVGYTTAGDEIHALCHQQRWWVCLQSVMFSR